MQLKPLFNELAALLSRNEITLIGQLPLNLSVYCGVELPLEYTSPLRMEMN
jgi:hypothetical protein